MSEQARTIRADYTEIAHRYFNAEFPIKQFRFSDNTTLYKNVNIAFIGDHCCGKTVAVLDYIKTHSHSYIDSKKLFHNDENIGGLYGEFVKPEDIYFNHTTDDIHNLLEEKSKLLNKKRNDTDNSILIFEDCFPMYTDDNRKPYKQLLMNGCCWKVSLLLTMTKPLKLPPHLRGQFDYAFIGKIENEEDRKTAYLNYTWMFDRFGDFEHVLDQLTVNKYDFLVIDNHARSNKLTDRIFWYHCGFP